MRLARLIKTLIVLSSVVAVVVWLTGAKSSQAVVRSGNEDKPAASDYVGSETCQACHEDQFKSYAHTAHATLTNLSSWKNKVTGCESCHGPGKAHVDGSGDVTKIISFKNKSPKEISESCLGCHAGKEERNNFRRGDHWRNDVGCTECHSPHSDKVGANVASSNVFVTTANAEKPGFATTRMLKASDPQLCISCHAEVKPQFSAPFHHKVMEGAMTCSDCHNPHGGFELKQTRLTTGADAACIKCHADKQGPFLYEHAPVKTEGCSSCHVPHGSANPRMLRYSAVNQLCLTCHSGLHDVVGAEETPSSHNQQSQYANCTACHVKIHGSRSHPRFFR